MIEYPYVLNQGNNDKLSFKVMIRI